MTAGEVASCKPYFKGEPGVQADNLRAIARELNLTVNEEFLD